MAADPRPLTNLGNCDIERLSFGFSFVPEIVDSSLELGERDLLQNLVGNRVAQSIRAHNLLKRLFEPFLNLLHINFETMQLPDYYPDIIKLGDRKCLAPHC